MLHTPCKALLCDYLVLMSKWAVLTYELLYSQTLKSDLINCWKFTRESYPQAICLDGCPALAALPAHS